MKIKLPEPGLYWFESSGFTLLSKVGKEHATVYGPFGSGDIERFYHPKLNPKFKKISKPRKWITKKEFELSLNSYTEPAFGHIKSPEGHYGVGFFHKQAHGLFGTIIWYNHPNISSHGIVKIDDEMMFA